MISIQISNLTEQQLCDLAETTTNSERLMYLAKYGTLMVKYMVAKNLNSPPSVMDVLSKCDNDMIKMSVITHPNTLHQTMNEMLKVKSPQYARKNDNPRRCRNPRFFRKPSLAHGKTR